MIFIISILSQGSLNDCMTDTFVLECLIYSSKRNWIVKEKRCWGLRLLLCEENAKSLFESDSVPRILVIRRESGGMSRERRFASGRCFLIMNKIYTHLECIHSLPILKIVHQMHLFFGFEKKRKLARSKGIY